MTDNSDASKREPYVVQSIGLDEKSQKRRDWRVVVNDKEFTEPISKLEIINDDMGRGMTYGWRPEGFDGVMLHEPGGGGAVTIPWLRGTDADDKPQIFVGLVEEYRGPIGGTILNAPRGFMDPDSDHLRTAREENREEIGHEGGDQLEQLGVPVNPNSDAFDTSGVANDGQPEGTRIYSFEVSPEEVNRVVTHDGQVTYRFTSSVRKRSGSKSHELIFGVLFVPITEASKSPDVFTRAAAGDLLISLVSQGVLSIEAH